MPPVLIGDPLAEYAEPVFRAAAAGDVVTVREAWQGVVDDLQPNQLGHILPYSPKLSPLLPCIVLHSIPVAC